MCLRSVDNPSRNARDAEFIATEILTPKDEFCAGLDGDSACYGDSGGPLVCEEDRKLCGVVSWGYDCNTNVAPAVYAQAAHYVDWFTTNSK